MLSSKTRSISSPASGGSCLQRHAAGQGARGSACCRSYTPHVTPSLLVASLQPWLSAILPLCTSACAHSPSLGPATSCVVTKKRRMPMPAPSCVCMNWRLCPCAQAANTAAKRLADSAGAAPRAKRIRDFTAPPPAFNDHLCKNIEGAPAHCQRLGSQNVAVMRAAAWA